MNRQGTLPMRLVAIFALVLMLSLSAFVPVAGATSAAAPPPGEATPTTEPLPGEPSVASTNPYVIGHPRSQTGNVGFVFTINVEWGGQDYWGVDIYVDWRDGTVDKYHCSVNCDAGNASFDHVYLRATDYYPRISVGASQPTPDDYVHVGVY